MANPHILVVEDDIEQAEMLQEYLRKEDFETTAVTDGTEGIAHCLKGAYAAAILDVMLPGVDGIEVLREVRRQSDIPIIMLTARGDQIDRVMGLELGADDYLAKPYYPREVVARLRAVLRRRNSFQGSVGEQLELGELSLNVGTRRAEWRAQPLDLTLTEFNLLHALLRRGGQVAPKEELSFQVLGRALRPFDRSLDVHASHLRQKLRQLSGNEIEIETMRGVGYRLVCRDAPANEA